LIAVRREALIMILREAVDRSLMANLPLPLAQAWRRVLYQKTPADVHERSIYALEALLKYLASLAAAAWVARGAEGEPARRACAALVRPSLGHWVAILRACAAALPDDDPTRSYLERVQNAAVDPGVEGLTGRRVSDILDNLPAYRNQVSGHGAGLSTATVVERGPALGALTRSLLAAAVGQQAPTLMGCAGSQLVQLMGLTAQVDGTGPAPIGAALFVRVQGRNLSLAPLWIFDMEDDDALVLNKGAGLPKVEYLSYGSPRGGSGLIVLKGPAATAAKSFLESATGQSELGGADVAALIEETEVSELANRATDRRFGPYRVVRKVAEGGQGVLYEAIQESPPRRVALKTLSLDRSVSDEAQRRMREEAAALARVEHPNVVPVYESGESDGIPWIAMKFVEGKSLAEVLDSLRSHPGAVTVADWRAASATLTDRRDTEQRRSYAECAAELTRDAARALAACHAHGIVHRDVKPGNLMLDADGRVILTDFGLARPMEARGETFTRKLVGTLQYLAPEALLPSGRKGPDGRVDVYGLGATLYELLSLRPPFAQNGQDEGALLHAVQTKEPRLLRRVAPGVPRDLETIVMKALEKDRDRRYPTMSDFADDLERYLKGEPIRARPPGPITRSWKWSKRHPARSTAIVAVILVALGLGLWQIERRNLELERQGAQRARQQQLAAAVQDDEIAKQRANTYWTANRFAEAVDVLAQAAHRLEDFPAPELADRQAERARQVQQARQIAEFYRRADQAAFSMGEDKDEQTLDACDDALRQLGIITPQGQFAQGEWWLHLPDKDLSETQKKELQQEIYRQILMVGLTWLKQGGINARGDSDRAKFEFRSCLQALDQAGALEQAMKIKPARVVQIWRKLAKKVGGLSNWEDRIAVREAPDPGRLAENPADFYFLGAGHFWIWQLRGQFLLTIVELYVGKDMDFKTPLATAERYLRVAVSLEPKQYWPHFMLGWALANEGDYRGAELAFGTCILLRPEIPRGYEWRATSLINQAKAEKAQTIKDDLRERALTASAESLGLDSGNPEPWWPRAELMAELERPAEALEAYARALELEEDVSKKLGRAHALKAAPVYARKVLQEHQDKLGSEAASLNAQAQIVLALVYLSQKDYSKARDAARKAIPPDQTAPAVVRSRAHAVLGVIDLKDNHAAEALRNFETALECNPRNYMAAAGIAKSHEKLQHDQQALEDYDSLLSNPRAGEPAVATTAWQRLEAHLGRYRMLLKLGREAEAQLALVEAKKINPRAVAKAVAP
jgi:serine/threonine protein kinase/tetratricopeptide (TPR) repeat protein